MSVEIRINSSYKDLSLELKQNLNLVEEIEDREDLTQTSIKQIYQLLNDNDLKDVCSNIVNQKYVESLDYQQLNDLYSTLLSFVKNVKEIKNKIDIDIFFKKGNLINIKKLKAKFKMLGRDKIFGDFDFKRLEELFKNPPKQLKALDGSNPKDFMIYDEFVVRKYIYGIIQMVINEMDLLIGYTGAEGMGKSCACSQDINLVYYLLSELKLIKYDYNIKEMWFGSLNDFIQAEDKYFDQKFRIFGLDEGNELNRQNWQDPLVQTFFQRLRRERYNQRIKFICLPQLGELLTSIVLSRMNFIFNMYANDDIQTGTLDKGFCSFYIVPRNAKIYSPYHKKELSKERILKVLSHNLADKKEFLKAIPHELLIKRFRKNHIWGFNKRDYDKHIKEGNKTFSVNNKVMLTEYEQFVLFITLPELKEFNLNRKEDSELYATASKVVRKISKKFEESPDLFNKYQNMLKQKKKKKGKK